MRFALVLALLLALGAVVFALQNPDPVTIQVGTLMLGSSTAFVVLATFIAGVLTGILTSIPSRWAASREIKALRKKNLDLQKVPDMGTPPASAVKTPDEMVRPAYAPPASEPTPAPSSSVFQRFARKSNPKEAGGTDPYTARFGGPPHDVGS